MSELKVNKVSPRSGTTVTIGDSGDTINLVGTIQNNGSPLPGDISSVTAGTGLSGGGSTGDVTLNLDLNELTTSTSDADGDFFAVVDAANAQKKLTKGNINISGFNNDSGFIDGSSLNADNLSSGTVPDARITGAYTGITNLTMSGDLTVDTSTLKVDSSNDRVGIGTSSPGKILDIRSADPIIQTVDTGDSDAVTRIDGNAGWLQFMADNNNTLSGTNITFNIDGSEKMRINSSGEVGINTSSPDDTLHVKGNVFIEDSSPEITFETTSSSKYNWQLSAQENIDQGFEISYGSQDADASNDTFTPIAVFKTNRVGINTSSPSSISNLHVADTASNEPMIRIETSDGGNKRLDLYVSNSDAYVSARQSAQDLFLDVTSDIVFKTNNSERMRIDSSGKVGIGTTNPNRMLTVEGDGGEPDISLVNLDNTNNNFNQIRFLSVGSDDSTRRLGADIKALYTSHSSTNPTTDLVFGTASGSSPSAERMRIDSSGNVGIGTTSPTVSLHVNSGTVNATSIFESTDANSIVWLKDSGGATALDQVSGSLKFTTGYDTSFSGGSEAMRIGSNGRVGIGTSTLTYILNLKESTGNMRIKTTDGQNVANASTSILEYHGTDNRAGYVGFVGGDMVIHTDTYSAGDIKLQTDGSERMRIDSSGNVGIGTTSTSLDALQIRVADTRVTTGRCLEVHHTKTDTTFSGIVARLQSARNTTNETYEFIRCAISGVANKFIVHDSGDVDNANNSYGGISDERVKQDITDANSQWNDIKALKIKNFKKKANVRDFGNNASREIGVIAQDLEVAGMNGLIKESKPDASHIYSDPSFGTLWTEDDEEVKNGTETAGEVKEIKEKVKTVKYSVLYMKSVKALQEAMERIETLEAKNTELEARITTLESNNP